MLETPPLLIPPHPYFKSSLLKPCSSMETSQQLSNESFSYSWLTNTKPSSIDLLSSSTHDRASATDAYNDFNFSLPSFLSPGLVPADQIFSDGLLLPLHLIPPPTSQSVSDALPLSRSLSLDSSSESFLSISHRYQPPRYSCDDAPIRSSESFPLFDDHRSTSRGAAKFLRNCTKSPKKIMTKYLHFLLPLCKKVKALKFLPSKPVRTSPVTTDAFASIECSCDVGLESSIHEAVLHCKRSIGQDEKWIIAKEHN